MFRRLQKKLGQSLTPNETISPVYDRLLNKVIFVFFVVFFLGLNVSLTRVVDSGFQVAHGGHILLTGLLALLALFRKKLPYILRLVGMLSIPYLLGLVGIFSYGLIGQGSLGLICATVFAVVFVSKRVGLLIFILSAIFIIVFMVLYTSKVLIISFDLHAYHYSISSWLSHLMGFIIVVGLMITVISGILSYLKSLANELNNRLIEIKDLNSTLESKVKARTTELEESNREKSRILSAVAHDLNNKLLVIMGYLSLVCRDENFSKEAKSCRYVKKALKASEICKEIINEMAEYARDQYDLKNKLITESVDIYQFAESIVEGYYPMVIEKNIELKMGKKTGKLVCDVNKANLSRVIDNLLTNAIKFTQKNGQVTLDIVKDQDSALLTIKDTGVGIPNSMKEHIFDVFTPSSRPGTAKEKSTGLGLSIVKNIVESHSGKIWFESIEGKGSIFFLKLPLTRG